MGKRKQEHLGKILLAFGQGKKIMNLDKFFNTFKQNFCRFGEANAGVLGKFALALILEQTLVLIVDKKSFAKPFLRTAF